MQTISQDASRPNIASVASATRRSRTGGQKHHPLFPTWGAMLSRCTNPKSAQYPRYGGRGIFVCDEWFHFPNFVRDMGARPSGMQIDRIDNDLGYFPGNCHWVTSKQNCRNRGSCVMVQFEGRAMTVKEAAELSGIPDYVLYRRLQSKNPDIFRPVNLLKGQSNLGNDSWRMREKKPKRMPTIAEKRARAANANAGGAQ